MDGDSTESMSQTNGSNASEEPKTGKVQDSVQLMDQFSTDNNLEEAIANVDGEAAVGEESPVPPEQEQQAVEEPVSAHEQEADIADEQTDTKKQEQIGTDVPTILVTKEAEKECSTVSMSVQKEMSTSAEIENQSPVEEILSADRSNGASDVTPSIPLVESDSAQAETADHSADASADAGNEEGTTTTVQFIAVSADEHARMVAAGELPESVHGADVHMQIPGADAQQVRLIAVDSNGVPVIEPTILQAAAEQAGIVFLIKDENSKDTQITIQQAMELSKSENVPLITATTATIVLDQGDDDVAQVDTDGNETEDDTVDGEVKKAKVKKPRLKLRVYSQKDATTGDELSFLSEDLLTIQPTESAEYVSQEQARPNDESVYEFQDPPTGGDEENQMEVLDPGLYKKGAKRTTDKNRDRRKIYQCRECPFYSHRHSNLIRHIKIHTDERPYQCHLCERAFRTNTLLRNHINTHTGTKPYKCSVEGCGSAFVTSGELTRHTRYIHTHEKPFRCTLCDYASVEISKLRRHFRSHTGERPYNCEECGKSFADSFHLKRHKMSHTGEKPYQCPECSQRFTQRGSVKMHIMQQHTKTAPKFKCEICHTLLGRKSDLNVHMRKQHAFQAAPTQCRYCDELFHDRWSLMQHQRTHRSGGMKMRGEPIVRKRRRTTADAQGQWKKYELEDDEDFVLDDEDEDEENEPKRKVTVYVEEEESLPTVSTPIITEIETESIDDITKVDVEVSEN